MLKSAARQEPARTKGERASGRRAAGFGLAGPRETGMLRIGAMADPAEREADRFAAAAGGRHMASAAPPMLRRKGCAVCGQPECDGVCGEDPLAGRPAPMSVHEALAESPRALGPALQERIALGLGAGPPADLGAVRVHDGPRAARAAAEVGARAFTVGDDIAFAAGAYRPGTAEGDRLIAHELAHVLQARRGAEPALRRAPDAPPAGACPPKAPTDLNRNRGALLPKVLEIGPKQFVGYVIYETFRTGDSVKAFADRALRLWVPWRFGRSPAEAQSAILAFLIAELGGKNLVAANLSAALPGCNYALGISPQGLARAVALSGEAAPKPGFTAETETPGQPGKTFALPALPAKIEGLDSQPIGATGTYVMNLNWGAAEGGLLGQVAEAGLGAVYHWEAWDITGSPDLRAAEEVVRRRARLTSAGKGSRVVGRGEGAKRDLARTDEDLRDRPSQIDADRRHAIDEGRYLDAVGDAISRATFDLEKLTRYGSNLLAGAGDYFGADQDRRIPWMKQGVFVVRCVAKVRREDAHARAPSVATKAVAVRPPDLASQRALDAAADEAAALDAKAAIVKALPNADAQDIAQFEARAARLRINANGTPSAIVDAELDDALNRLSEVTADYKAQLDAGLHPRPVIDARERVEALLTRKRLIGTRAAELGAGGLSVTRLDAAFVSRVTGDTYPLLLQLGEPRREGGSWRCTISDVTTIDGGLFPGSAPDTGNPAADRQLALQRALETFTQSSDYGDGSLTVRLHGGGWLDAVPEAQRLRTLRVRASPRGIKGAKQRLKEVATALALLGLIIASPAIGVFGGLLAAGLAADNIVRRWREGTLRPDTQLVGDLLDVLSAVAMGAKAFGSLAVVNRAGGGIALQAIRAGAAGLRAVGTAADVAGNVGGIILANAEMVGSLIEIGEKERSGALSPSEARRALTTAIASGLQGNALAIGGHLAGKRMAERGAATEPLPRPAAPEPHGTPRTPAAAAPARAHQPATMSGAGPHEPMPSPIGDAAPRPKVPGQAAHDRWIGDTLEARMGTRPPPLPKPGAAPVAVHETVYGLKTMEQALRVYDDFRARAPGREIGIWRSAETGDYAVVAGEEGRVGQPRQGREGEWGNVLHNHPNPDNVLVYRNPAPQDVFGTWQEAQRLGRPVTALIEHDLPGGGRAYTAITARPHPDARIRIEFRRPGAPPEPHEYPSMAAYADDWGARSRYAEPGSAGYHDLINDLDRKYSHAPPAGSGERSMAGTVPPHAATPGPAQPAQGGSAPLPKPKAAKPNAAKPNAAKPKTAAPRPAIEPPALMTERGDLTAAGLALARRQNPAWRTLSDADVQQRFAGGNRPLERIVRAEIEAHYRQTGTTPTSFPLFPKNLHAVVERMSAAAQAEGRGRRIDAGVVREDLHHFVREARTSDAALARAWDTVERFANDRSYRPEVPFDTRMRQECRDFLAYRDKDTGGAFLLGKVGNKIPDALQVALDFDRIIVIDATAALGNPVHGFKTAFYAAVIRRMVGGVTVQAGDYRAFLRQSDVSQ